MAYLHEMSKVQHLQYIKEKGPFKVDIPIQDLPAFSEEMGLILEKWGHWFKALCEGVLEPLTHQQQHFIEAIREANPVTLEERVWYLYLKRKEIEEQHRHALNRRPELAKDSFYSREDKKTINRTVFGVMNQEHRR